MKWQDYQLKVAKLFRKLGCIAKVNAIVRGVRAKHNVDVWIKFRKFGIINHWAVECKYWKSYVTKEKVLAFKGVLEDIGADRGIIITKKGFQRGAIDTATSTNITLTTLPSLTTQVKKDFYRLILEKLEKKTINLGDRIHNLYITKRTGPDSITSSPKPGVDGKKYLNMVGQLSILETGFKFVRMRKIPIPTGHDDCGDKIIFVRNTEKFVEQVARSLKQVKNWIITQENAINQTKKT